MTRIAKPWGNAVLVGAMACIAGAARPAAACSGPVCVAGELFPARGSVPANLPAVLYWPPARWSDDGDAGPDSAAPSDVRFVRLDAAGPVDVDFELVPSDEPSTRRWAGSAGAPAYRIVPAVELQPGARYAVWVRDCDGDIAADPPREPYDGTDVFTGDEMAPLAPYAVFDVVAAAPLPTALGSVTLEDTERREVRLGGGAGCYEQYEAASVIAEVQRASEPFFDAIAFSTYVDGELYRPSPHLNYAPAYGNSWVGHGRDELVALCDSAAPSPLSFGRHSVRFEGRVAGSDEVLVGETEEFELAECSTSVDGGSAAPDGGPVAIDAGTTTTRGDSSEHDAGIDAAAPSEDADARSEQDEASAGIDAAAPPESERADASGEPRSRGGDGCAAGGDARGHAGHMLFSFAALALLRRRRARPRRG